jgi:hypothetical protein
MLIRKKQRTIRQQQQEQGMNRTAIALSLGLLLGPALAQGAIAQGALPTITEAEAHAIGVDAFLYFYPLISTDITRLTSTNIEAGKEPLKGPMNRFVSATGYPPGDLKLVVRINFDTLYSVGWLDLTKEPVVVSSPDTNGRYFLLPISICGPMCSPLRAGERLARRLRPF